MASDFKLSTGARNRGCDGIVDGLDASTVAVRTGAPPATPATADSGTLLGTLTCGTPAFGDSATGTATANAITSDTDADNSGDAGHFRILIAGPTCDSQGTAGNAGDTPDMTFDNKTIVATGTIAISSMTITVPVQ